MPQGGAYQPNGPYPGGTPYPPGGQFQDAQFQGGGQFQGGAGPQPQAPAWPNAQSPSHAEPYAQSYAPPPSPAAPAGPPPGTAYGPPNGAAGYPGGQAYAPGGLAYPQGFPASPGNTAAPSQGMPFQAAPPQAPPHSPPQAAPQPAPAQGTPFQVPPPQAPPQTPPPQGPGWAPQPPPPPRGPAAPYPPPAWRPPRRKSGAGAVVGALMGVLALVFVLVVVVSALAGLSHRDESVSPVAIPTFTFSPFPSDEATRDTEPTRKPTSKPTSQPTTRPTPVLNRTTKNNSVYRAGSLAKTNCRAGNASIYNHAQFKALILKTGACMGKAWAPALERVGIDWSPPKYMIAARKGRGACGDYPSPGSNVPYYCPSNATIYASTSAMAREYGPLGSWNGIIISMMAHEYGHHIQNLSGISDSWWRQTLDSGSRSGKMALSRRHELQATCFGGMFMRSVAASYPIDATRRNTLLWAYSHLGDQPGGPRDHGNTRSNAAWFRQGYTRPMAYQCNTWVVGSSSVS